jgi:AcrR family transcriptional regulator
MKLSIALLRFVVFVCLHINQFVKFLYLHNHATVKLSRSDRSLFLPPDATLEPISPRGQRTRSLILAAARDCFERLGIETATIIDIAEAADYSRPIIYKHFKDKADIVDHVCLEEMQALQTQLAKLLPRGLSFAEQLTELIVQGAILANRNLYLRRYLADRESWLRSQIAGQKVHEWVRESWDSFLRRGQADGTFARDLDVEEAVNWINMNQSQLLLRFRDEPIDPAQLRRFVRRFVLPPLLA